MTSAAWSRLVARRRCWWTTPIDARSWPGCSCGPRAWCPAGETPEQAADRLATLDSVTRARVETEARAAEERAREVRAALERQRAAEAAARASRE